jgi:hypothetical protein
MALDLALEGFKAPTLVNPCRFPLAEHKLTRLVMAYFWSSFHGAGFDIYQRQEDLTYKLVTDALDLSVGASGEKLSNCQMPPGYRGFLLSWIGRAVIWLAERKCHRSGTKHAGVHSHGDDLVYKPESFRQGPALPPVDVGGMTATFRNSTTAVNAGRPATASAEVDIDGLTSALLDVHLPADTTVVDILSQLQTMRVAREHEEGL